jgi:hypothetical protein
MLKDGVPLAVVADAARLEPCDCDEGGPALWTHRRRRTATAIRFGRPVARGLTESRIAADQHFIRPIHHARSPDEDALIVVR